MTAALVLALADLASAAPALQLPWPTGQVHRINSAGSGYGCDFHVGRSQYAIDFDHVTGQAVSAVAAGTAHSGNHAELGNYVWIDHGGGFVSVYAHFSSFAGGFPRGVAQGEVVGGAGSTGAATGAHLHFVMRSGASGPFNGSAFLPEPMSGYGGFGAYGCGKGTSPPYTSQATLNPIGAYDAATSPSPGLIRVSGWSFDPDARTTSLAMHVYVGGEAGQPGVAGHAFTAAGFRPDVAAVHAGVGDAHGLDQTFETGKRGSQPVCLYAINIGTGSNVLLGCKTVTIADPNPVGSYDEATSPEPGKVRVRGWTFDPNAPTLSTAMHVYVGGEAGQPGVSGHAFVAAASRA